MMASETKVTVEKSRVWRCAFCWKSGEEVAALIAGPGVFICNECVCVCVEAISTELGKRAE